MIDADIIPAAYRVSRSTRSSHVGLAIVAAALVALALAPLWDFAIGSWVVAEVFRLVASQVSVLGGGSGTSLPARLVTTLARNRQAREFLVYWVALALAVAIIGLIVALLRSRWGLALTAIRDNEVAARSNGVDVRRTKLAIYVVAASCTAMLGALIFLQRLRISPDAGFSVNNWTALVIFMTGIGGIGSIKGPILGTIVFFLLRETLSSLGRPVRERSPSAERLGLAQGQMEHKPQRQHEFDGQLGMQRLSTGAAPLRRRPASQRRLVQPQREVATAAQTCLMRRPTAEQRSQRVRDPVAGARNADDGEWRFA